MSVFSQSRYIRHVQNHRHETDQLTSRLKYLVADLFRLDIVEPKTISDDAPLIGGDLGLDSLDALELAICIEEEFGLTIESREESHRAFASISSLAGFIAARTRPVPVEEQRKLVVQTTGRVPSSPALA